jgi:hypothetical protein
LGRGRETENPCRFSAYFIFVPEEKGQPATIIIRILLGKDEAERRDGNSTVYPVADRERYSRNLSFT